MPNELKPYPNMKKVINKTNLNPDEWFEKTMLWLKRWKQKNQYDVRCPRCGFLIRKGEFQVCGEKSR